jgi:flagellar biosynthesis protein FlhB
MEVSTTSTADPVNMYNYINNMLLNPTVFFIILIIIILYFVLFHSLGNSNSELNMGNMGDIMGTENKESSKIFGFIIIFILFIAWITFIQRLVHNRSMRMRQHTFK